MSKAKYCCFFCPKAEFTEKSLDDKCPTCKRPYGHPLYNAPQSVNDYAIVSPLGRGFYAATYSATKRGSKIQRVLKISPVSFYEFPDFHRATPEQEFNAHEEAASGSYHISGIRDRFVHDIIFSDGSTIKCNVMELEYIEGDLLQKYLDGTKTINVETATQIAIDLLRLRGEFEQKQIYHNDLHDANIIVKTLKPTERRADAVKPDIKVSAIDLGSVADSSKSNSQTDRRGDLLLIAEHIDRLTKQLLKNPSAISDRDYRLALALESTISIIKGDQENARIPESSELVNIIQMAYWRSIWDWKPWSSSLVLKTIGEHYNAQTLEPWHAPALHVDPNGKWTAAVVIPGPQIITGMRGCGKTLLLRSLEFHARASKRADGESSVDIIRRISSDGYVGLFVSAQRLLDLKEASFWPLETAVTRLFVHYALKGVHAIMHMRDIDPDSVNPGSHKAIGDALTANIDASLGFTSALDLEELEATLTKCAIAVSRSDNKSSIRTSPADAFTSLAQSLRQSVRHWRNSRVFYLLDDVSTRYLGVDKISTILTGLMFSNPICAFKLTSEWQTIELGLKSPGREHPVSTARDLSVFDLGAEVYKIVNSRKRGGGADFVKSVLSQRVMRFTGNKQHISDPRVLLGDIPLEDVAKEIGQAGSTSKKKKRAYGGISCLAHVCVGDIGDVIKLYEEIVARAGDIKASPITREIQSECFSDISSRRLYDLNRRKTSFRECAITFAEASHELLVRSVREYAKDPTTRIRQYCSIYVRINTEDPGKRQLLIDQLRELIDAGVFVFSGGAARTKTKDSDPILQFKLSYRKIYGLASHIGLAERDRYELSGADLEEWLFSPSKGKEILLRNLGGDGPEENDTVDEVGDLMPPAIDPPSNIAVKVIDEKPIPTAVQTTIWDVKKSEPIILKPSPIRVACKSVSLQELASRSVSGMLLGYGFEDRTLVSSQRTSEYVRPHTIMAVNYDTDGHREEIQKLWNATGVSITDLKYQDLRSLNGIDIGSSGIIDISGLSKPFIYHATCGQLAKYGRATIVYTAAEHYFPSHEDIARILEAQGDADLPELMVALSAVFKGESGPYSNRELLDCMSDSSRRRALMSFASSKHERLMSLLDKREYDEIQLFSSSGEHPRSKASRLAAKLISQNYQNASLTDIASSPGQLGEAITVMDQMYTRLYFERNCNVEIGLTGNKLQAVAGAALSARRKIAQAWYISPTSFDYTRFTTGTAETSIIDIEIQ